MMDLIKINTEESSPANSIEMTQATREDVIGLLDKEEYYDLLMEMQETM